MGQVHLGARAAGADAQFRGHLGGRGVPRIADPSRTVIDQVGIEFQRAAARHQFADRRQSARRRGRLIAGPRADRADDLCVSGAGQISELETIEHMFYHLAAVRQISGAG